MQRYAIPKTTFLVFNCPGVLVGGGRQGQRDKNHRGILALPSGKFLPVTLEIAMGSFQMVWKVSGWSEKFSDNLESFQIV